MRYGIREKIGYLEGRGERTLKQNVCVEFVLTVGTITSDVCVLRRSCNQIGALGGVWKGNSKPWKV